MTGPLTPTEIERYARHLVIREIGGLRSASAGATA